MREVALTTKDNPYSPFTQFKEWYMFDVHKGYDSCGKVARIAKTSDQLSDFEYMQEIERAIDAILSIDFLKIFKKVSRELPPEEESSGRGMSK